MFCSYLHHFILVNILFRISGIEDRVKRIDGVHRLIEPMSMEGFLNQTVATDRLS